MTHKRHKKNRWLVPAVEIGLSLAPRYAEDDGTESAAPAHVALGALPGASVMAQDPVTITYWHGWTEQWENYVQDIVDAFHAHQDAIRVEPLVVPYGDFPGALDRRHLRRQPA